MRSDDAEIRTLIERWAEAVHSGDMDRVLADHAEDIVMFDVPPPANGVRGIAAYRATWPPFFEWQAQGAAFEIVELQVTAGQEVAYAYALLRCAKPKELRKNPGNRLRLTIGLARRAGAGWSRTSITHFRRVIESVAVAGKALPVSRVFRGRRSAGAHERARSTSAEGRMPPRYPGPQGSDPRCRCWSCGHQVPARIRAPRAFTTKERRTRRYTKDTCGNRAGNFWSTATPPVY